jgi:hypothetical protein
VPQKFDELLLLGPSSVGSPRFEEGPRVREGARGGRVGTFA